MFSSIAASSFRRTAALLFLCSWIVLTQNSAAALITINAVDEEATLVRVQTKSGGPYVGELIADKPDVIELFDFVSNKTVSVQKVSATRIENPISLDDAVRSAGIVPVLGRKLSLMSSRAPAKGKIAKISPQLIYLNLGESSGVDVGQKVQVYRNEGDIVDPDTGKVLAAERPKIAELEITEVSENVSKAKLLGDLEVKLQVGDEVELPQSRLVVAVCPPSSDDGSVDDAGISLAEELTTALVQRKISVVERSALETVLAELLAQNTVLFDEDSAQKLGKLTGATMVLTGKVVAEKSSAKVHLRLVDVSSGEILIAVSSTIKATPRISSANTGDPNSKSSVKAGSSTGKDFDILGKTRLMPSYLTATAALEKVTDGGLRFQGVRKNDDYSNNLIMTKDRNLLDRNFVFEVLVTFQPNDGIAHIGFGTGRQEPGANRRENSTFLRFHSPDFGEGKVELATSEKASVVMGTVAQKGVHRVCFTKEGDSLTILVDPENDGPSDDDFETVISNVREQLPSLTSKNAQLFLGGTATYTATRLKFMK
ncbi:MAG: hypothetical protein JNM43_15740 [Planctomycetaceae bacterium]|nr:hypothetical protein [Planctomycetaceae bacterium]